MALPEDGAILKIVDELCDEDRLDGQPEGARRRRGLLEHLCMHLPELEASARQLFVRKAAERGIVKVAVRLIEQGGPDLAGAASNFLAEFAFNSDTGARAVLEEFDRIAACYKHLFETPSPHQQQVGLFDAAILLCVNIAAFWPSGHKQLIPLVRPVCLQVIKNPATPDKLRGHTITLLANLSTTVSNELRSLHVAGALLELVTESSASELGRSVAESVIIFLHGSSRCPEMDALMARGVVGDYCVPLMSQTLRGGEFRGMYPHLLYSARLFQVMAQCPEYAEALVAHEWVVPLLVEAACCRRRGQCVESDLEGRALALQALHSFVRLRLWPHEGGGGGTGGGDDLRAALSAFSRDSFRRDLPGLLCHDHVGIRAAATGLWSSLHPGHVSLLLRVGCALEAEYVISSELWKERVLSCCAL